MLLAGLDIGTTGCKITIYDKKGIYQNRFYNNNPVSRNTSGHEIDVENIWQSVKKVIKSATHEYSDISAIGVTSFGETCVLLDDKDKPIRNAMLYTDPRGTDECGELIAKLGKEKITRISGVSPHSMYSLPKVMWIKKHFPDEYERTRHILMMEDYIIYMLTGKTVIDYSLATRSMGFDINKLTWSDEIFSAAGINKNLFSEPIISGTIAGVIRKDLVEEFGLNVNTFVVPVGHDQVAAVVGSGIIDTGCAVDGAGTVECVTPVFDKLPEFKIMGNSGYAVVPYLFPDKYVTYAFLFTGGALISWYINNLARAEKLEAKRLNKSVYDILEKQMKDEPTGILVLPHFAGAATPYMDEKSKGVIVGLTLEHSTSDLYRAMMEGIVYEMRLNLEKLQQAGIYIKKLRATGGGAASQVWMQMKADILDLPVTSLDNTEAGAAGCVMMAGIAAGVFKDLKHAAKKMIKERCTFYPRKEQHNAYMKCYEKYKELYKTVRPLV